MLKTIVPKEHQDLGRRVRGFSRQTWDESKLVSCTLQSENSVVGNLHSSSAPSLKGSMQSRSKPLFCAEEGVDWRNGQSETYKVSANKICRQSSHCRRGQLVEIYQERVVETKVARHGRQRACRGTRLISLQLMQITAADSTFANVLRT